MDSVDGRTVDATDGLRTLRTVGPWTPRTDTAEEWTMDATDERSVDASDFKRYYFQRRVDAADDTRGRYGERRDRRGRIDCGRHEWQLRTESL